MSSCLQGICEPAAGPCVSALFWSFCAELIDDLDASIASDNLRWLTEAAQECLTHSPSIRKARFPGNHINRMARLFHHQASCFKAEILNGLRGRLPRLGSERTAELPWAQVGGFCQLFHG